MSSRASVGSPSSRIRPRSAAVPLPMSAWRNSTCSSRSECMGGLPVERSGIALGDPRLVEQDRQFRDVVVPFDERRHAAKACERMAIERPYRGDHARAVLVDKYDPPGALPAMMAGYVYLAD